MYIHEVEGFPNFTWDKDEILGYLTNIANLQGRILGKMLQFGFDIQQDAMLNALTEEITKSSEIEGEILNSEQVRSSLARQLNINLENKTTPSHHIDGVVQAMMDTVNNYRNPLTHDRLFGWHAALFPTGRSGIHKIHVAEYRSGEMRVVSDKRFEEVIHYVAPNPALVSGQMDDFLRWLNNSGENPLLKAAIAHLWFVIIHPFDDGNGRLTRIITEMMLARAENTNLRFYSMSAQIQKEKKSYYNVLEHTTSGGLNITTWLKWFFECLGNAIDASSEIVGRVLKKAEFWHKNAMLGLNKTQQEIVNKMFDGFDGNLTSGKAEKIFKISQTTAFRLLTDLVEKGIMEVRGKGRSTHYVLKE